MAGSVYGNITQRSLHAETYKYELLGHALGRNSQKGSERTIVIIRILSLSIPDFNYLYIMDRHQMIQEHIA